MYSWLASGGKANLRRGTALQSQGPVPQVAACQKQAGVEPGDASKPESELLCSGLAYELIYLA